jgi:hypothetical protein
MSSDTEHHRRRPHGQSVAGWAPTTSRSAYDADEMEFWLDRGVSLIETPARPR